MKRFFNNNYRLKRQLSVIAAIVIVGIAAGGFWLNRIVTNSIYRMNQQNLAVINSLISTQISNWYLDEKQDIQIIAGNPFLIEEVRGFLNQKSPPGKTKIMALLSQIEKEHNYTEVILASVDGEILIGSKKPKNVLHAKEQKIIEEIKALKTDAKSTVYQPGQINEKPLLSLITRINENNNVLGVLIGRLDLTQTIFPVVERWSVQQQTAESYLFTIKNDSIEYLSNLRHDTTTSLNRRVANNNADWPEWQAAQGKLGAFTGKDYRGEEVLGHVAKIEGSNSFVISKIDKSEVLASITFTERFIITIVVLVFLIVVLIITTFYQRRQKHTYKKLSEKENLLSGLFHSINDVIFTVSMPDRKIKDVNQAISNIFGYDKEEVIGRQTNFLYPTEEACQVYGNTLAQALENNESVVRAELELKKKDGTEIFCDVQTTFLESYLEGESDIVVSVIRDITEKKKREERLMLLNYAVESSAVSVAITDEKGIIDYVNPFFTELTGYSYDEVLGKTHKIVYSGKHSIAFYKDFWNTLRSGNIWRGELHNRNKNGNLYWERAVISPIKDDQGEITHFVSVKVDISKEKKISKDLIEAKEKAEEGDRLKSAFLANMSHEIRTPMNGILGFTNLLLEPDLSSEEKESYIQFVHQSGQRMLNTVNDIVEISRIESGETRVSESEVDLNKGVEELVDFFKPEAEKKGLKLILEKLLPDNEKNISTDKNKLDSILTNLIKNAIKYTDSGTIKIGCHFKGSFVEFYVKDTGIGIPKDRQEAIFNRFEQADISDTRAFEGSGLGLAIAKSYVEMLGGKIWVESREGNLPAGLLADRHDKAGGSTFYFTLPLHFTKKDDTVVLDETPVDDINNKELSAQSLKILIAEDDETSIEFLSVILKDVGREILHAKTGVEAVELSRIHKDIDLILLDIKLPAMDGYEATRRIREFNKEVIIIAQTAYGLSGDKKKAIEAGCNDYISKPIDKNELRSTIKKYFSN